MAEWCNSNTTFQEIVENGAIPFSADPMPIGFHCDNGSSEFYEGEEYEYKGIGFNANKR